MKRRVCGAQLLMTLALLAGLAVLMSACGESAPDEFVGTWHMAHFRSPPIVIMKTDDGYRGTIVYPNNQPHFDLKRAGDRLKGQTHSSTGPVDVEIIYQGRPGHLLWRGAAAPGLPVSEAELARVSTSTTVESTSPL